MLRKESLKVISFTVIILSVCLLLVSLGYLDYQRNKQLVLDATKAVAVNRATLLNQYVSMMSEKVSSMVLALQVEHEKVLHSPGLQIDIASIEEDQKLYRIYGEFSYQSGANLPMYSFLTANKSLDIHSQDTLVELSAALALDSRFESLLDNLDHPEWAYFVSQRGYKLIAPNALDYTNKEFQSPFYQQAAPEQNPEGTQIITDLYNDEEGKGLMITISEPVYINDEFIGVVSIDIGIQLILEIIVTGEDSGETVVFGDNGYIVAKRGDLKPNQSITFSFDRDALTTDDPTILYLQSLWGNELFVMHRISPKVLVERTGAASLYSWVLLALASLMLMLFIFWLKEAKKRELLMHTDPLTGLKNRRGLNEALQPIKAHLIRTNKPCSLLIMDIDKFKSINDNYGHNIGDEVIGSVAKTLGKCIRAESICARWGGEEFLVFLPDARQEEALEVAERIRSTVANVTHSSIKLTVTISIGLHTSSADEEFTKMVNCSDEALYIAKENGRNRVEVSTT